MSLNVLRWPNTFFMLRSLLMQFSACTKITKTQHAVDTAIILFAQCSLYLCYFFFVIPRSVLIVLVFYYKGMLEKVTMQRTQQFSDFPLLSKHSRPQSPRSFWSAPRIATSGLVQYRKSAIHGLPVTLRMLSVKFDKSVWFWSRSIVFTKPFKTGMSLDLARGRDSWC